MTPTIQSLIDRGALFVCNHSGGKDSQAMFAQLKRLVPAKQLVVIHAHLPGVEWDGIMEVIYAQSGDIPVHVTTATKTFFEMVENRGFWPSPSYRQCTSDLKRGPIEREIRGIVAESGNKLIVNCMGLRAQESVSRAKATPFKLSARNSKAGREWYDWLPIFDMLIEQVWQEIAADGQAPHWAYAAGMTRLSCCFCIMSSPADIATAAKLRPALFAKYEAMEKQIDQTFLMPCKSRGRRFLGEVAAA